MPVRTRVWVIAGAAGAPDRDCGCAVYPPATPLPAAARLHRRPPRRPAMSRLTKLQHLFLSTALLTAAACAPAEARPLVDIAVIDRDSGQWLPEYAARGEHWIAGVPGHRYSVRLTNTTGQRILVVLSIDGVNAVSGETASAGQTGYVLAPWQSTEINGWRKSLDDVAQFVFTDLPDSYAARTGRPDNVGVIGVAAFRERQRYVIQDENRMPMPAPPVADAMRERAASKASN